MFWSLYFFISFYIIFVLNDKVVFGYVIIVMTKL